MSASAESLNDRIEKLQPGERLRIENLPFEQYLAAPGIGSTLLKAATKTMEHYELTKLSKNKVSRATQQSFNIGTAVHSMVLEPDKFFNENIIGPEGAEDKRLAPWKSFAKEHKDSEKTLLKYSEYEQVLVMAEKVTDKAGVLFSGGQAEVAYWYRCPETNLILKARADYQSGDGLIDLKTGRFNTPDEFMRTVLYDYSIQDGLYRLVTGLKDMIFVGVTSAEPHSVFSVRESEEVRAGSKIIIEHTLQAIRFAEETNTFPGYDFEVLEANYPNRNF